MKITFFGHQDAPRSLIPRLKNMIRYLIQNHNADFFYVGNHGDFDRYVIDVLQEIKQEFPHIQFFVVLAYMPNKKSEYAPTWINNTLFPEELTRVVPKFAIIKRNDWMLQKSDGVVAYITRDYGGAVKFYKKAIKQNKMILNIAEME